MAFDVVVVAYNSSGYLPRLASSLQGAGVPRSVVIVDNASIDNSVGVARRQDWGGSLNVIQNPRNVGFGAAMNQGVKSLERGSEFVLLINPDVQLEPQTVPSLLAALISDDQLACVGPRMETSDGQAVSSARALPTLWTVASRRVRELVPHNVQVMDVGWVCGAVMLWRRQAFEQIGGFSPDYFLYYEDVDICRKAWHAGLKIATVAEAKAVHDQGHGKAPSKLLRKYSSSSRRIYAKKWLGPCGSVAAFVAEFAEEVARRKHSKAGPSK
ncbi:glycosyltransferase family 2 protein [Arthrobacter sp. KFRI-F3372]|uniref:glycosyltransferase family 2 protein n=1 Tax=Pseudarthrobacter oxydans TaxID=1671 RepID=UPI0027A2524F|nr:glycosyltransferase family 2 protein [Arthrobacter sp. KFRI-F3372]